VIHHRLTERQSAYPRHNLFYLHDIISILNQESLFHSPVSIRPTVRHNEVESRPPQDHRVLLPRPRRARCNLQRPPPAPRAAMSGATYRLKTLGFSVQRHIGGHSVVGLLPNGPGAPKSFCARSSTPSQLARRRAAPTQARLSRLTLTDLKRASCMPAHTICT
jgi:hypothetical protein